MATAMEKCHQGTWQQQGAQFQPGHMATVMGTMAAGAHGNINGNSVTRGIWQQQRERCERGTWQQRGAQCQPGHIASVIGTLSTRAQGISNEHNDSWGTWQHQWKQC
ncbi:hypothetical protein ACOMHN_057135 [Nucella lapillus]